MADLWLYQIAHLFLYSRIIVTIAFFMAALKIFTHAIETIE